MRRSIGFPLTTRESDRLHGVMASAAARADAGLPGRLVGLLDVPGGSRVSEMRQRDMPRLARASVTLAKAARALLPGRGGG